MEEQKFKPVTLEKVKKDIPFLPHDIQLYCYHKMNGRDDEAEQYRMTYLYEHEKKRLELSNPLTFDEPVTREPESIQ